MYCTYFVCDMQLSGQWLWNLYLQCKLQILSANGVFYFIASNRLSFPVPQIHEVVCRSLLSWYVCIHCSIFLRVDDVYTLSPIANSPPIDLPSPIFTFSEDITDMTLKVLHCRQEGNKPGLNFLDFQASLCSWSFCYLWPIAIPPMF